MPPKAYADHVATLRGLDDIDEADIDQDDIPPPSVAEVPPARASRRPGSGALTAACHTEDADRRCP
jgi:hypothetical protein